MHRRARHTWRTSRRVPGFSVGARAFSFELFFRSASRVLAMGVAHAFPSPMAALVFRASRARVRPV